MILFKHPATQKDYNATEAFDKTQAKNRACLFNKTKHKLFTEKHALAKSFVPGVGQYNEVGFAKLSPKPRSLRKARR